MKTSSPIGPSIFTDGLQESSGYAAPSPIAETLFDRKKIVALESSLTSLQKTVNKQYATVSHIEGSLKALISEEDLHRAIGLTFQEFELRLASIFEDSNRKLLLLFVKRDELADMQGKVDKKVGRTEWDAMSKRVNDLRLHVDMMAAAAMDNKEALKQEFDRKADSAMVDLALKSKADFRDLCEVRARVERLEILVTHQDAKQTAQLRELRDELTGNVVTGEKENQDLFKEHDAQIKRLREELRLVMDRFSKYDKEISRKNATSNDLAQVVEVVRSRQEDVVLTSISSLKEMLEKLTSTQKKLKSDIEGLGGGQAENKAAAEQKTASNAQKVEGLAEQVEFLLQANEFGKRRQRDLKRDQDQGQKKTHESLDKLLQQVAEIDRSQARQDRDIRAIDTKASQNGIMMPNSELPHPCASAPEERLQNVLAALEQIGGGIDEEPVAHSSVDDMLARASPRASPRGIDSSRNLAPPISSPRGAYGGPRAAVYVETTKNMKKKK